MNIILIIIIKLILILILINHINIVLIGCKYQPNLSNFDWLTVNPRTTQITLSPLL